MRSVDYAIRMSALYGDLSQCGDLGIVKEYDDYCLLVLIDVLGHGKEARYVALKAEKIIESNYKDDIRPLLLKIHDALIGTRGAVISLCLLNRKTSMLTHVGIGNISVKIFGLKNKRLVSKDGIVGYGKINPIVTEIKFLRKDILLMSSDGVKEHFDPMECIDILSEDAQGIAVGIMKKYGKKDDDSSCVVMKNT